MTNEEKCKIVDETRMQEFSARANELSALEKEFGDLVIDIVKNTRAKKVEEEWKEIAKNTPKNNIQGILVFRP